MSELLCSIIVPVYKSEDTLQLLYERVDKTFNNIEAEYELIFVDDCGNENTWEVLKSLRESNKKVRIIRLTRNFGQHNALMCGFSFAVGEFIVTIDDDLQNPPEEIPKLIDAIKASGHDVVYGAPEERKHSFSRNLFSSIFNGFISLIYGKSSNFKLSNFRIIKKSVIDQITKVQTPNPFIGLLILKVTDRIGTVVVKHHERTKGKTTYSTVKLIRHFLNGVLYHSALPLKVVSLLGILSFCISFILGLFYLISYLRGIITVSGWTTLVLLILFFSGIIMFSLGIVGEYLFRIIQEVHRNPQYVIREKDV
ncbi:MAG: glycosyltransferase family 2 protein [Planctomycetota bacterium]|jgi:dolichol-phosphate mannosyltransferase/undecaprenyl-phosphate 4-deoxy-4-formamido-L-arabinose transferase